MITLTSFSSFAPRSDATTQPVDASADSSTNFFSLLLALFSPGVTQPQASPVESADISSATPEFAKSAFPLPEPLAEDEPTEETAAPSNTVPLLAQPFLLTAVAPFLWGNGQAVAETPLTTQATTQNMASLIPAAPSALTSINGEMNGLNVGYGEAATALTADRQEPESMETPLQPTASGVFAKGTTDRGTPMRSYQLLDASMEWKPTKAFFHNLEPLAEGEQINMPVVTPGEQNPEAAKPVAMEDPALFAKVNTGETPPSPTTPKDFELPGNVKTASSQPEFVSAEQRSVEQHAAKSPFVVHNEQLITALSSQGKARGAVQNSSQPLTDGSLVAPNMLGNAPTAALPSQPQGSTSTGNVETWREVMNQVRDGIVTNIDQSNREAHIQLAPPELGKLDIQLVVEGEHIHAHIVAESADVGALIQSHLPELKQALQSHRLDLDTVRVEVQTGGGESNPFPRNSQQEERTSRRGGNLSTAQAGTRDSETTLATSPVSHRDRVNVWA